LRSLQEGSTTRFITCYLSIVYPSLFFYFPLLCFDLDHFACLLIGFYSVKTNYLIFWQPFFIFHVNVPLQYLCKSIIINITTIKDMRLRLHKVLRRKYQCRSLFLFRIQNRSRDLTFSVLRAVSSQQRRALYNVAPTRAFRAKFRVLDIDLSEPYLPEHLLAFCEILISKFLSGIERRTRTQGLSNFCFTLLDHS